MGSCESVICRSPRGALPVIAALRSLVRKEQMMNTRRAIAGLGVAVLAAAIVFTAAAGLLDREAPMRFEPAASVTVGQGLLVGCVGWRDVHVW
jgi:hypothetical protein